MKHPPARTRGNEQRPASAAATRATVALGAALLSLAAVAPACARSRGSQKDAALAGSATLALATVTPAAPAVKASPAVAGAKKSPDANACPAGMVLVEGEYCPEVEQRCLEWMDPPTSRYHHFRCARYARSVCKSKERVHMRYCIDATERAEEDTSLPRHFMSWTSSKKLCEAEGGRLCRESEWQFACEGEEMRPYPYGWERDSGACNVDRSSDIGRPGRLVDHRSVVGSHEKCASPFGVQDMAGNVEEWVQADGRGAGNKMGWKEVLKGSWWIPSRHACRQFQVGHDAVYNGAETGTRCCKDAPPREVAAR
ncbi:MAG: SUMF1/EgtB/PvdO family nonheme iron enzyme [Labilithrix sp.]|nr:SUMF1/EgtB/PvdO family nonheme iron enzyme [Labilithrix sp.]MCW5835399.1 SUMF1/EgtB/PvdO family nonheme iron enzyme [Labilithrix sp.]